MGGHRLPGEAALLEAIPILNGLDPSEPTKMPLEARMYGIFAGFLTTWVLALGIKRGRAALMPPPSLLFIFVTFVVLMGLDGINATLYDVSGLGIAVPYLYAPRLDLRLAAGLLGGTGMAGFMLALVNSTLWREGTPQRIFADILDLLTLLVWNAMLFAFVVSGSGLFFYPISLLGVLGVIALTGVLNLVFLMSLLPHAHPVSNWREALNPIAAAIFLSGLELGLMSILRYLVLGNTVLP
jgi:hypothetical protein